MAQARKDQKIVIIGDGEFGHIAYEYFTYDSPYEVAGFSAERAYLKETEHYSLPVVPFEEVEKFFPPSKFKAFVAVTHTQLNKLRTRLYAEAKKKGYTLVSFVSPRAFVWRDVEMGDNCFIFENNVLQYQAKVGNNVIMWSGNILAHHARIANNCYVSSHVVISGFCEIGEYCFLGVNSSIRDYVKIADNCVIGAGAVILQNTEPDKVYSGNPAKAVGRSSLLPSQVSYIPGFQPKKA